MVYSTSGPLEELEIQEARAFMRERFLKVMNSPILVDKVCDINLFGDTKVQAVFVASDANSNTFAVRDLVTNLGVIPHALLRTQDIISLQVRISSEDGT